MPWDMPNDWATWVMWRARGLPRRSGWIPEVLSSLAATTEDSLRPVPLYDVYHHLLFDVHDLQETSHHKNRGIGADQWGDVWQRTLRKSTHRWQFQSFINDKEANIYIPNYLTLTTKKSLISVNKWGQRRLSYTRIPAKSIVASSSTLMVTIRLRPG